MRTKNRVPLLNQDWTRTNVRYLFKLPARSAPRARPPGGRSALAPPVAFGTPHLGYVNAGLTAEIAFAGRFLRFAVVGRVDFTPRALSSFTRSEASAVIYRAFDLFVRACHEDPKPGKTASERDFSCAACKGRIWGVSHASSGNARSPCSTARALPCVTGGESVRLPETRAEDGFENKMQYILSFFPICNIFMTLRTEY